MKIELVRWFESSRVPRYTSYPTAPHFSPAVTAAEHALWLQQVSADDPVSLYLHVPFCRVLCWYCGCHTRLTHDQDRIDAYGATLRAELELVADNLEGRPSLTHLHWGGGTPTTLGPEGFAATMQAVARRFRVAENAELAVELDPRTVHQAMLDTLQACGINRASLGVQSFDPAVQQAINRVQSFAVTASVIEGLRARGVPGINVDLLYGLPHQTVANCIDTVAQVALLRPDRIAVFGYAHVPSFKKAQQMIDPATLPGALERVAQYEAIAEALEARGYVRIGLDHFALPHDAMARAAAAGTLRRNFQGYTTDPAATLIGLGASSISSFAQGYVQNEVDLKAWRDAVHAGRLPTARGVALSAEDRLIRDLIEAIMCAGAVDLAAIADRHGMPLTACEPDPERFAELERLGIARRQGTRVEVAADCWPLLRVAAAAFDRYLRTDAQRHAAAV
jgi:oxygen-independent coproporphyrinogen-3 oxidase